MNALPELWAAVLGWLDLLAGRRDIEGKFNLSRAGLVNAAGCYFAVVVLVLAVAAATGHNPGIVGALVALLLHAAPLLAIWLVIGGTALVQPLALPASFVRVELPALLVLALLAWPMLRGDRRLSRGEGGLLVLVFVAWVVLELLLL